MNLESLKLAIEQNYKWRAYFLFDIRQNIPLCPEVDGNLAAVAEGISVFGPDERKEKVL